MYSQMVALDDQLIVNKDFSTEYLSNCVLYMSLKKWLLFKVN